MAIASALTSSARSERSMAREDWVTPAEVVAVARATFGGTIDFDPWQPRDPAQQYARDGVTVGGDGLTRPWPVGVTVFVNPPHSELLAWAERIVREYQEREAFGAVVLVPARPDTRWWATFTDVRPTVCFIKGRLTFGGAPSSAPFPSVLIHIGHHHLAFVAAAESLGECWRKV